MNTSDTATTSIASSEFILGGQKSGKSRRAEMLARAWLDADARHAAVLIATAQPWDDEMRQRIARHQRERAERVPGMRTLEEPRLLAQAIADSSNAHTLVVVDCLTLWLTNWLMPMEASTEALPQPPIDELLKSIARSAGPVVIVGNEIGLGVIPMGAETRAFVDSLGRLNQDVAGVCSRVTLMAAGLPLMLKGAP